MPLNRKVRGFYEGYGFSLFALEQGLLRKSLGKVLEKLRHGSTFRRLG
jgi:hypothetical protein